MASTTSKTPRIQANGTRNRIAAIARRNRGIARADALNWYDLKPWQRKYRKAKRLMHFRNAPISEHAKASMREAA